MWLRALLLCWLAAWRLTRLLAVDSLLAGPRGRVQRWAVERRYHKRRGYKLDDLAGCPHCLSVWVAAAVVAAWWWRYGLAYPLFEAGAVMALCSMTASATGALEAR